ncbi:MAG: SRPBCC family protein [Solirubrobacterales bacterium]|nr:SRPBCC family protein [Solirubrobacterales bacterium]
MIVHHSIVIDKPFDEVWAVFDDPSLQPKWLGMMKSFKQVKGMGNEKGALQKVVFTRDSGDTELTVTILDQDPSGHVVARYEGMQLPFVLTSNFVVLDDDSTEWAAEIEVKLSLLQKALTPVLKGAMGDLAKQMGSDFKKYVEA